jgi:hypothetical protein
MFIEINANFELNFYPLQIDNELYVALRYVLIVGIYILFCKDWKGISQMIALNRIFCLEKTNMCVIYIRAIFICLNWFVMFWITLSCNVGE